MKRKIIISILTLIFVFWGTACSLTGSTTQKYLKALERTDKALSLQSKTQCKISIDLSQASENTKKMYEELKEISFIMDKAVDNKNGKFEQNIFFSAGKLMMNYKMFGDGKNIYMKFPYSGDQYMKMGLGADTGETTIPENNKTDDELYEGYKALYENVKNIWNDSIKNELITSEGSTVKNTPDGDMKVTQLSLELTDEKAKNVLKKLAQVVSENQAVIKSAVENGYAYIPEDISNQDKKKEVEDWFRGLPGLVEKYRDRVAIEKLKLTVRIDRDSHIIDETLEGVVVIGDKDRVKADFHMNTTRWNINRPVKVNLPDIKPEDIMDPKDLDSKNSELLKKLFKDMDLD